MPDQSHSSPLTKHSFQHELASLLDIGCVQLRRGQSLSTRETRDANWSPGWLTQVMAQPLSLSDELNRQVQTATQTMGKKAQKPL